MNDEGYSQTRTPIIALVQFYVVLSTFPLNICKNALKLRITYYTLRKKGNMSLLVSHKKV